MYGMEPDNNAAAAEAMMTSHSKHLVRELERKNREIMRDIHQLKHAHKNRSQRLTHLPRGGAASSDPSIVNELQVSIKIRYCFWSRPIKSLLDMKQYFMCVISCHIFYRDCDTTRLTSKKG